MVSMKLVRAVASAALTLGLVAGTAPASAAPTGTLVGTGTLSPGLPTSGCAFQSVTLDGTLVSAGTAPVTTMTTGVYALHFEGFSSICETSTSGAGSGTISGGVTGNVSYSRTGSIVTLSGTIQTNGGSARSLSSAVCAYYPTSANPTTSYGMVCVVA